MSAAALKEDTSSTTPVIENIPVTKPTTLTLRHTYKEGESKSGCTTLEVCTGQVQKADSVILGSTPSVKHPSIHQLVFFEGCPLVLHLYTEMNMELTCSVHMR